MRDQVVVQTAFRIGQGALVAFRGGDTLAAVDNFAREVLQPVCGRIEHHRLAGVLFHGARIVDLHHPVHPLFKGTVLHHANGHFVDQVDGRLLPVRGRQDVEPGRLILVEERFQLVSTASDDVEVTA